MYPSGISSSKYIAKTSNMAKSLISEPSIFKITLWYHFIQELKCILLLLATYFNDMSWYQHDYWPKGLTSLQQRISSKVSWS